MQMGRTMERSIRRVHVRRFPVSQARLASALDALYSDTALDPFPRDYMRPWRTVPDGARALVPGSRCGHGALAFEVSRWDGRVLAGHTLIEGLDGLQTLTLEPDGENVIMTNLLEGRLSLRMWLIWKLLFSRIHDWVGQSIFDRLEIFFETGQMPAATPTPPPGFTRVPHAVRRLIYRMFMPATRASPEH